MNYFKVQTKTTAPNHIEVLEISEKVPFEQRNEGWVSRWDFKTFEQVLEIADEASKFAGEDYIAVDSGEYCSPRYDVIKAPQQHDAVSYTFNGDSYPCGFIKTISKTMKKITTTTGEVFYRQGKTGSWKMKCWFLTDGHHNTRNPHF
jgi:hypothetical protein